MRKTLLEKCEEIIDTTQWPFIHNNLKTEKIFNDLIQFHTEHGGSRDRFRGDITVDMTMEDSISGSKVNLKKLNVPGGIGRKGSDISSKIKGPLSSNTRITGITGQTNQSIKKKKFAAGGMNAT